MINFHEILFIEKFISAILVKEHVCASSIFNSNNKMDNGCDYTIKPTNETCWSVQKMRYTLVAVKEPSHYYLQSQNYATDYKEFSHSKVFKREKTEEFHIICPSGKFSKTKHIKIMRLSKGHAPLRLNLTDDQFVHKDFDENDLKFVDGKLQNVIETEKKEKDSIVKSMERYREATKGLKLLQTELAAAKNYTEEKIGTVEKKFDSFVQIFGYIPLMVYALVILAILFLGYKTYSYFGCNLCKSERFRRSRRNSHPQSQKLRATAPTDSFIDLRTMR